MLAKNRKRPLMDYAIPTLASLAKYGRYAKRVYNAYKKAAEMKRTGKSYLKLNRPTGKGKYNRITPNTASGSRVSTTVKTVPTRKRQRGSQLYSYKKIQKVVKNLHNNQKTTFTKYRGFSSFRVTCGVNKCSYHQTRILGVADQDVFCTTYSPKVYDASANNHYSVPNMPNGGVLPVIIRNYRVTQLIKNNYNAVAHLEIFIVRHKSSAPNILTPHGALIDYGADVGITSIGDSILWNLPNSTLFEKCWRITERYKFTLIPGEETKMTYKFPSLRTDSMQNDQSPVTYNKFSHYIVIRIQGDVAHDIVNVANVGLGEAAVDVCYWESCEVGLGNGTNVAGVHESADYDSIVNGAESMNVEQGFAAANDIDVST